jgi:uncharacterized protein YpbB
MAKPILVINYCVDGISMDKAVKNLRELQKIVSESNANDEYYTFLLPVTADSNVQVFYDKYQNETQYEELKEMIETKLKVFENKSESSDTIELEDFDGNFNYGEWSRWEKIKNFFYKLFNK